MNYLPTFTLNFTQTSLPLGRKLAIKDCLSSSSHTLCESHVPEFGVNPLYDARPVPRLDPTNTRSLHLRFSTLFTTVFQQKKQPNTKTRCASAPCTSHLAESTVRLSPCWKQPHHSLFLQPFLFKGTKEKMGGEHKKKVIGFVFEGICEVC